MFERKKKGKKKLRRSKRDNRDQKRKDKKKVQYRNLDRDIKEQAFHEEVGKPIFQPVWVTEGYYYKEEWQTDKAIEVVKQKRFSYKVWDAYLPVMKLIFGDWEWDEILQLITAYLPPKVSIRQVSMKINYGYGDYLHLGNNCYPGTNAFRIELLDASAIRPNQDLIYIEKNRVDVSIEVVLMHFSNHCGMGDVYFCRKGDSIFVIVVEFELFVVFKTPLQVFIDCILPQMRGKSAWDLNEDICNSVQVDRGTAPKVQILYGEFFEELVMPSYHKYGEDGKFIRGKKLLL